MCIFPVQSRHSLRQALSVTKIEGESQNISLWVCCDSVEGVEIRAYNIHTMAEMKKIFIRENQIQCIAHYGEHVWVVTRAGMEYGMIDIRNAITMDSVHKIHLTQNRSITCITANDETVYIGTNDGYCISYKNDGNSLKSGGALPNKENQISECAIDGITCIDGNVWISHSDKISHLDLETLDVRGTITLMTLPQHRTHHHVGQLARGMDHIMWGAHVGGTLLSAWNTQAKCHMYNIDTGMHLERVSDFGSDRGLALITAMTPALDTVWVGMASGHILIFHKDQLLTWFHLFADYVHFLTCIPPSLDPSGAGKCMVASGGKNVKPLVPLCKSERKDDGITSQVVIWEAYNAKTMRQIMLIEEQSPGHLDNYDTVRHLIREGNFKDGTNLGSISFQDRKLSVAGSIAGFDPIYTNCPVGKEEEEEQTDATEEL
jgi:hypothetical protein